MGPVRLGGATLAIVFFASFTAPCGSTPEAVVADVARRGARSAAARASPGPIVPPPAPTAAALPARPTRRDGCAEEMARVGGFCVDRYEAHLVVRSADGGTTPHSPYERPHAGATYEARSERGVFPQAYIDRDESQAACAHAGKRLCTMHEWRRACQGERATLYPYGARREPGRCNTDKAHLLTLRFGYNTLRWRYEEEFNDPSLNQTPGFLARTGAYDGCVSDAGVHDLVGNLHEWVSDTLGSALMARLEAEQAMRSYQPSAPGNGVFMGGFYSTREEHGPGCTFTTIAHEPRYHDYSTGFRCCADAD